MENINSSNQSLNVEKTNSWSTLKLKKTSMSPNQSEESIKLVMDINNMRISLPELTQGKFISPVPSPNIKKRNFFQSTVKKKSNFTGDLGSVKKRLIFDSSGNKPCDEVIIEDKENNEKNSNSINENKQVHDKKTRLNTKRPKIKILKLR